MKPNKIIFAILTGVTLTSSVVVPVASAATTATHIAPAQQRRILDNRKVPYISANIVHHSADGTIKYYMGSSDPYTQTVYQAALSAWANLGVIKFVPVASVDDADISLCDYQSSASQHLAPDMYGEIRKDLRTDSLGTTVCTLATRDYLLQNVSDVTLRIGRNGTDKQFNAKRDAGVVLSAEHEIGHALGLAHDNNVYLVDKVKTVHGKQKHVGDATMMAVMYPDDNSHDLSSVIPLGVAEKRFLKAHY